MRIAITGASGFIGGRIARALSDDGHDVLSFGRREPGGLTAALPSYRTWDVTSGTRPLDGIDALVHCAAAVGQWGAESWYDAVNVRGTRHVLDSLPPTARVVHISSASVYARQGSAPLREDARLDERLSAYVRTKVEAERLVMASGRPAIVLRPHVVYGPGDTTLWPRVLAARRHGRLRVPGDGRSRISTTHVDNLVDAVRCALRHDAPRGIYNVADADAPTVDALIRTIFERKQEPVSLRWIPAPLAWVAALAIEAAWRGMGRTAEPPLTRYAVASLAHPCLLSIERARDVLGYVPRWTPATGPL